MPSTVSIAEAKAHLSDHVRKAEGGEAVLITRHGRPVAALVAAGDLAQLRRLRAAGPEGGLASVAGGWEHSEELVRLILAGKRVGTRRVRSVT